MVAAWYQLFLKLRKKFRIVHYFTCTMFSNIHLIRNKFEGKMFRNFNVNKYIEQFCSETHHLRTFCETDPWPQNGTGNKEDWQINKRRTKSTSRYCVSKFFEETRHSIILIRTKVIQTGYTGYTYSKSSNSSSFNNLTCCLLRWIHILKQRTSHRVTSCMSLNYIPLLYKHQWNTRRAFKRKHEDHHCLACVAGGL